MCSWICGPSATMPFEGSVQLSPPLPNDSLPGGGARLFARNLQNGLEITVNFVLPEEGPWVGIAVQVRNLQSAVISLQRITLLKAPLIHVLDEATSALDPRTERQVLGSYFEKVRGQTVVIIAHRLTSVTNADRIFVLSEGKLVESGTHARLYEAGGLYRVLFDEQSREIQ